MPYRVVSHAMIPMSCTLFQELAEMIKAKKAAMQAAGAKKK